MRPHVWLVLLPLTLAAPSAGQMTPVGWELTIAQSSGVLHRSPAVAAGEFGNFDHRPVRQQPGPPDSRRERIF